MFVRLTQRPPRETRSSTASWTLFSTNDAGTRSSSTMISLRLRLFIAKGGRHGERRGCRGCEGHRGRRGLDGAATAWRRASSNFNIELRAFEPQTYVRLDAGTTGIEMMRGFICAVLLHTTQELVSDMFLYFGSTVLLTSFWSTKNWRSMRIPHKNEGLAAF